MIGRIRRRLAHALDRRFLALHHRVENLEARVEDLAGAEAGRDDALREEILVALRAITAESASDRRFLEALHATVHEQVAPTLRFMAGNDTENRRALEAARARTDYELAFTEATPLVSVILPTRDRTELLLARAVPSILSQTYDRLEVLVIGDVAGPETEAAVRGIDDDRVVFLNVRQRFEYSDSARRRYSGGALPRNEGYRVARGRWLFDMDDDDSVPEDAIESLLAEARDGRLEVVQGVIRQHTPNGSSTEIRPTGELLSLSGGLVHAHLRFFAREHVATPLGIGGDVFRGERMIRAGVRIGLLDKITYEYYPALLWQPQPPTFGA